MSAIGKIPYAAEKSDINNDIGARIRKPVGENNGVVITMILNIGNVKFLLSTDIAEITTIQC